VLRKLRIIIENFFTIDPASEYFQEEAQKDIIRRRYGRDSLIVLLLMISLFIFIVLISAFLN